MEASQLTHCGNCHEMFTTAGQDCPRCDGPLDNAPAVPWTYTPEGWQQQRLDGSWWLWDGNRQVPGSEFDAGTLVTCPRDHAYRRSGPADCPQCLPRLPQTSGKQRSRLASGTTPSRDRRLSAGKVLVWILGLGAVVATAVIVGMSLGGNEASAPLLETSTTSATTVAPTTEPLPTTTTVPASVHALFRDLGGWEGDLSDTVGLVELANFLWQEGQESFAETRDSFVLARDAAMAMPPVVLIPDLPAPENALARDMSGAIGGIPAAIGDVLTGLDAPDTGQIRRLAMNDLRSSYNDFASAAITLRLDDRYVDQYGCSESLVDTLVLEAINLDYVAFYEIDYYIEGLEWSDSAPGVRQALEATANMLHDIGQMSLSDEAANFVATWRRILEIDVEFFQLWASVGVEDGAERMDDLIEEYDSLFGGFPDEFPTLWCER